MTSFGTVHSGIVNDLNDWATETGGPRYMLDLLKRIVTVNVETMKILKDLPKLEAHQPSPATTKHNFLDRPPGSGESRFGLVGFQLRIPHQVANPRMLSVLRVSSRARTRMVSWTMGW